jgi:hypothetical protein
MSKLLTIIFCFTITFSFGQRRDTFIVEAFSSIEKRSMTLDEAIEEAFNEYIDIDFVSDMSWIKYRDTVIETDSTIINIKNNTVYMIINETYKQKDSILHSVRYNCDTAIINYEGWKRKNGTLMGNWIENTSDGTWICTINHDNDSWTYNEEAFPHFKLLDTMKLIGDSLIILKYGVDFFNENVRYQFFGDLSKVHYEKNDTTIEKKSELLGSWTDPIIEWPNEFHLQYSIKFDEEIYDSGCIIEIELDSLGKLIEEESKNSIGFWDRVKGKNDTFSLTYDKALEICTQNGLDTAQTIRLYAELKYYFSKSMDFAGEFIFEVKQEFSMKEEGNCPESCTIENIYYIWRINPWTSELIDRKKYMWIDYYNNGYQGSSGIKEIE